MGWPPQPKPALSRALTTAKAKSVAASAVTNGSRLLLEGDQRTPWARRYRDLCRLHIDDLGGADAVTEAQISLIRRCSAIEVQLESLEGLMSRGVEVDIDVFARVSGTLSRMLRALGLERRKPNTAEIEAQRLLDQYEREDAQKE